MSRRPSILHFVLAALLWLPLFAAAQQRSSKEAEIIAQRLWKKDARPVGEQCLVRSLRIETDDAPCYVVYRADSRTQQVLPGFMLIAVDTTAPTLLAYSEQGVFPSAPLPAHIREWIEGYGTMSPEQGTTSDALRGWLAASQRGYADVAPLLGNREWGQDNPYNLLCPTIDGKYTPSGCVATALAQIMCYHQWPRIGKGSITYHTSTHHIPINYDFSSTVFEWNKLQDSYMPLVDLGTGADVTVKDNRYVLSSIGIDENSMPPSKCYVNINGLTVMGASAFTGETLLVLTDEDGNFVSRASSAQSVENKSSGRIVSNNSYLLYVPASLPDGQYRLYVAVRADGAEVWSLSAGMGGRSSYLQVVKQGNTYYINDNMFNCGPSDEDVHPVASLLQAVGAAVRMDYDLSGSGSTDSYALSGLIDYLDYDTDMFFANPKNYTDSQWHEMLQREITEGRPVYYTGQGTTSGHAFVIDGFKRGDGGTTYYHINWGWDGLCNGYYLLNILRPSSTGTGGSSGSNYSNNPSMLIGMQPDNGTSQLSMSCGGLDLLRNDFFAGNFLLAQIKTLAIQSSTDFVGTLKLVLQSVDAGMGDIVVYENNMTIVANRGLTNYYVSSQLPKDVPAGRYALKAVCVMSSGEEVYIECASWPSVTIQSNTQWLGGGLTQSLQKVAVGGVVDLLPQGANGILTLKLDSLVNPLPVYANGQLAVGVCDNTGRLLALPTEKVEAGVNGYGVVRNMSLSVQLSRHMPNGNYLLRLLYLPDGESLWTFCDRIVCHGSVWWADFIPLNIPFSVQEGRIKVGSLPELEGAEISWTTGVLSIGHHPQEDSSYTDLLGRKVMPGSRGIYLRKKGSAVQKVIY